MTYTGVESNPGFLKMFYNIKPGKTGTFKKHPNEDQFQNHNYLDHPNSTAFCAGDSVDSSVQ